jgi:hypothetical protein
MKNRDWHSEFKPDLTPQEMLELGVFCGKYFDDIPGEFPEEWFSNAKIAEGERDCSLNYFNVDASQPLKVWQEKGWINEVDPKGWFQWYCRYYLGRRCEDDERQIKRWKAISRHAGAIAKNCRPGDLMCRPKQRQALLHWAYDSRNI